MTDIDINNKRCLRCSKKTIHTFKGRKLCKLCQMALEDKIKSQTTFKPRKAKILFYDIETTPLKAWIWRVGEQVIRHTQLDDRCNSSGIICVAYKWNDKKPSRVIHWGYNEKDSEKVVKEFDKIASKADIVIGKNSDRFDVKHLNTQRMIAGLPGLPNWLNNTDDLERQFRKTFWMPSYSLDYLSKALLKDKGKDKMNFSDWIDIVDHRSRASYRKMLKYCKNDVENTANLWKFAVTHFKPRFNMATFNRQQHSFFDFCCRTCGSTKIKKNGTRPRGKTVYQMFYCNEHGGYAGDAPINLKTGKYGKIG